jgi:Fe-S oxidoreductase
MNNDKKQLLSELQTILGEQNVLSQPEHLYVYSRFGEFGIKEIEEPLAVIRINSENELTKIQKLVKNFDFSIVRNDHIEKNPEKPQKPFLLVDAQKPINIQDLSIRLKDLYEKKARLRSLKNNISFSHWIVSMLQERDGYRLYDMDEDIGFCIVQSYFDNIQTYSAKGRLILAKAYLTGDLQESNLLSNSIFSCTACGQCYDQLSLEKLEVNNLIIKTRNKIVQQNKGPNNFDKVLENIKNHGNPPGLPAEDRILWIEEQVERYPYNDNQIIFWPGCTTSYRLPELVEDTCCILEKTGYDFGLLGEHEGCCGLILYLSGHWNEARKNGEKIIKSLNKSKRLVTNCSGCYYCFSKIYPLLGITLPFEIMHTSQIIKESIQNNRVKLKEINGSYMWHDPCDLGRHSNVYEPPRYILNSIPGLTLVEPNLSRENTLCCGAGGGLWMFNEKITNHVSHIKLAEGIPQKLDGVVTGCPTCLISLRNTVREEMRKVTISDIVEIVRKAM